MGHAAPLDASSRAGGDVLRRAPGGERRGVRRAVHALASVILTGLFAGAFLIVLETAVAEPDPRRFGELLAPVAAEAAPAAPAAPAPVAPAPLPYGGALQRPVTPNDLIGPGGLLGLGLLTLGLANGLVFIATATFDGVAAPSPTETRRRLSNRSDPGIVPGGRREVRRTVPLRATAPAASAGPALADAVALRSVPGRPMPGTTYAPFPRPGTAWREHVPTPAPKAPAPPAPVTELDPVVPEAEPEPVAEPVAEPVPEVVPPRRPSPVPRDGGDDPQRAGRRGTGPWGWRPARPDPVPWRNPVPVLVP